MEFVIFDSDFNYIKAMTEEKQTIQIRCKNNKKTQNVAIGSSLSEVFRQFNLKMDYGPISAKVNNKVEGLDFQLYHSKDIEFQDMYSASGSRSYARTLFFVLCKAVHDLYPISLVIIDIPVSNGYYVDVEMEQPKGPFVKPLFGPGRMKPQRPFVPRPIEGRPWEKQNPHDWNKGPNQRK